MSVNFFGDLKLNNNSIVDVKSISGMWGKWSIDENGKLVVKEIETDTLKVKTAADFGSDNQPIGITIYDEITKEPYCIKVRNGQMVNVPGRCGTQSTSSTPSPDTSAEQSSTPPPSPPEPTPLSSEPELGAELPTESPSEPTATSTEPAPLPELTASSTPPSELVAEPPSTESASSATTSTQQ